MVSEECRSVRKQVHEYLDGEIGETASVEMDQHFVDCDGCRTLVVEFRSVKTAVEGKAARRQAPRYLAVRIRQRIEEKGQARSWVRIWDYVSPRPVLAFVILALVVTSYVHFQFRNNYALARELTRDCFAGHEGCENSPKLPEHIFTSDVTELNTALSGVMGITVRIPDLAAAGYDLVEGHDCNVGQRRSAHAYFDGRANDQRLSFFCVPAASGNGSLGDPIGVGFPAFVPPTDCWENELEEGMNIALWRSGVDRLCVLLGHISRQELEDILEVCVAPSESR